MSRNDLIAIMWRAVESSVFISRQDFVDGLDGWEIAAKEIDGEMIGATLTKGPEFHFVTFGPKKAFPRALMRECVQPIIDRYGFVRTRTPSDDTRQCRFNRAVGFTVESTDDYFTTFRMERLSLHGRSPCLS